MHPPAHRSPWPLVVAAAALALILGAVMSAPATAPADPITWTIDQPPPDIATATPMPPPLEPFGIVEQSNSAGQFDSPGQFAAQSHTEREHPAQPSRHLPPERQPLATIRQPSEPAAAQLDGHRLRAVGGAPFRFLRRCRSGSC